MSDPQPWRNPRTSAYQVDAAKAYLEPFGRTWVRTWWPALLWAAVIFTMSTDAFSAQHTASFFEAILRWFDPSMSTRQFQVIHHYIRKSAHFTEYFVFCLLLYRGVRGARHGWRWTWGLTALFIAASYSILDEIHQAFVASRQSSPYDSLIDSTGAFVAFTVLWLWFRLRTKNLST